MQDLTLVSLDDLLEEINKRFDIWVFSGMQLRGRESQEIVTMRKWRGNSATCVGLASQLQFIINDQFVTIEADGDSDSFEF